MLNWSAFCDDNSDNADVSWYRLFRYFEMLQILLSNFCRFIECFQFKLSAFALIERS